MTDTWNSSTAKQVLAVGETPTPQAGKWGWGPPTEELWQEISTAYGYYMKLVQGGTDSDMALWTQQLMQLVTTGSKFTGYPFENYGVWRLTASLPGLPAQLTSITPMASWLYGGRTTLQGLDQLSLKGRVYVFSQSEASASQYPIDFGGRLRTGALIRPFQPPIATLALTAVMLSADGKYAYASFLNGAGNGAICQYGITADGTLAACHPFIAADAGHRDLGLALSPDGRSAYVTASSQESPPSVNQVVQCSIAADGSLSLKTRSSVTTGAGPSAIAISADGKHAYVTNTIGNTMTHFLIAADGTLSDSSDSVATGTHPYAIALSADGKNAYVANENAVWQYSIAADGTLPSQTPASLVTADGTQSIVLSSDGLSAYVVAAGSSQVFQFSISTGGTLNRPKSPATVTTGNLPYAITLSDDGLCAYVLCGGMNGTVWQYWIASDGTLSAMTPVPATPGQFPGDGGPEPGADDAEPAGDRAAAGLGPHGPVGPAGDAEHGRLGVRSLHDRQRGCCLPCPRCGGGPAGNVYVADNGGNRVVKVAPDGSQTTLASGFSNPCGVAVDSAGNVYVADTNNKRVVKVAPGRAGPDHHRIRMGYPKASPASGGGPGRARLRG